jgi:hypothetical protein
MRFMVMHKVDALMEAGGPPLARIIQEMGKFIGGAIKAGVFENGAGLHPSSRRARLAFEGGKRTVTRGPFAGGNELLAGFALIKAASMDEAIEHASRIAVVLGDVEIEIGAVVEPWDLGVMEKPADAPLRFLLLRKADRAFEAGEPERPGLAPLLDELGRAGVLASAATLAPSAQGARYRKTGGKREWTDGPFTESKELVAGFSIVKQPSLADARKWAEAYADILGDNEVDVRLVAGVA